MNKKTEDVTKIDKEKALVISMKAKEVSFVSNIIKKGIGK